MTRGEFADSVKVGVWAGVLSGAPSTLHAVATGTDPLEATYAAGAMALPDETDPARLIVAAAGVHLAISIGWAIVLDRLLPRRATIVAGGAAGVAIAAFDLGVVGPRFPRVAALPRGPQVADHVAFGAIAGALIARRRARR